MSLSLQFVILPRHRARFMRILGPIFLGLIAASLADATEGQAAQSKGIPENTTYVYERMWPSLQQPWYFEFPFGVATAGKDYVYIADTHNHRIQKFTPDGKFVAVWGRRGTAPGEFDQPFAVAVDKAGTLYVTDRFNHRIQQFDADGSFLREWGGLGAGPGQFDGVQDIALDASGHVYVTDSYNHRIQKFTSEGGFLTEWGAEGSGTGQFAFPSGIAVDDAGSVYVADNNNHRVQKFDSNGTFLLTWGSEGSEPGKFIWPNGLALDADGHVYVADSGNERIQKFSADGAFVTAWGNEGAGPGEFEHLRSVAVSDDGFVYAASVDTHRIQKFSREGQFLAAWNSWGAEAGQFEQPYDIAVDADSQHVYVADRNNHRIQEFSADGQFVTAWGRFGTEQGAFNEPTSVALGGEHVYVADTENHRVQMFTELGAFVSAWGSEGTEDGQFKRPTGVAVDGESVYVADNNNHRIQKFTSAGTFVLAWGSEGSGPGQFRWPHGLALDENGNVYVADRSNHRIQKFSSDGVFVDAWGEYGTDPGQFILPFGVAADNAGHIYVAEWESRVQKFSLDGDFVQAWGSFGSAPGQFNQPFAVAADAAGSIYVADTFNHRVQKFRPVAVTTNQKTIVVAAGGAFSGNNLWDTTRFCANFAYRALTYRGFTSDTIHYLTSDTELDLDGNGEFDDVDGDATNANLQTALTQWAADAEELVVYLVDHGGTDTFRMSGTETLHASQLAQWLDTAQQSIPGNITVIYDACQSGSFMDDLAAPGRIVVTSADSEENAYFLSVGTVSFSNFFWTEIFNGATVGQAFDVARAAIELNIGLQTPQIDDPGGIADTFYLGSDVQFIGEAPIFNEISPAQSLDSEASASLYALPFDEDGIARVWAVIRPPGFAPTSPDNPVLNLPTLELFPTDGLKTRWEGTYDFFTSLGTYQIAVYCRDAIGNTSLPMLTTVEVTSPLARRAILAGGVADKASPAAMSRLIATARNALLGQGYGENDVRVYGPESLGNVTGPATLNGIEDAITNWAGADTQDIVFYYIGAANAQGLQLGNETLTPTQLDAWLDVAQSAMPGPATVVIDADFADAFIGPLLPPQDKTRIVLASTGGNTPAAFLDDGVVSFSNYFWVRVLNGANLEQAYRRAAPAMRFISGQQGQIDDDGDGISNEAEDGIVARKHTLGAGVLLAGDDPVIGGITEGGDVGGANSAHLTASDVTTTATIASVTAYVESSGVQDKRKGGAAISEYTLEPTGNNDYAAEILFDADGTYHVAVVAVDEDGNASIPATTTFERDAADDPSGDGVWDAVDIQLVINAALGISNNFDTDLNNDETTDAVDVQLAINTVLGVA